MSGAKPIWKVVVILCRQQGNIELFYNSRPHDYFAAFTSGCSCTDDYGRFLLADETPAAIVIQSLDDSYRASVEMTAAQEELQKAAPAKPVLYRAN